MLCNSSTDVLCPLVPELFQRPIFEVLHVLSHPGTQPSICLIWPGLCWDVWDWCRQCHPCQASKVAKHTRAPVVTLPPASQRFGSLHLNSIGPLPPSEENRYLLTIVDCFSRWPEAFPLQEVSAASCCWTFLRNWLPHYDIPDEIISDRGAQITGSLWSTLLQRLGIGFSTTTAYHPPALSLIHI